MRWYVFLSDESLLLIISNEYCIAQNFGRVSFWQFVPKRAFGRENFGGSCKTKLLYFMHGYPVPSSFSSTP